MLNELFIICKGKCELRISIEESKFLIAKFLKLEMKYDGLF